jgi:hypothetical protein
MPTPFRIPHSAQPVGRHELHSAIVSPISSAQV